MSSALRASQADPADGPPGAVADLAEFVRPASALAADGGIARLLPVAEALRPLLPHGGLRRGSTISIARAAAFLAVPARAAGRAGTAPRPGARPGEETGGASRDSGTSAASREGGKTSRDGGMTAGTTAAAPDRRLARPQWREAPQTTGGDDPSRGATLRAAASRAAVARSASTRAQTAPRLTPLRAADRPGGPGRPEAVSRPEAGRWGGTSLMLALLAEASRAGSWCAVVGLPELGVAAAAELGVQLERLALVPHPGDRWSEVVAALLDGFDVVTVAVREPVAPKLAGRLSARARQRGSVLLPMGPWDSADLVLEPVGAVWQGLGPGHGRLKCRHMTIAARGRGAAARPREVDVWLPASSGEIAPVSGDESRPADGAGRARLRVVSGD